MVLLVNGTCMKFIWLVIATKIVYATKTIWGLSCDVVKPWHCDRLSFSEVQFEYRKKPGDTDPHWLGKALFIESTEEGDFEESHGMPDCPCATAGSKLTIKEIENIHGSKPRCYELTLNRNHRSTPQLCIKTGNAFWYGGAELHGQRWPINDARMANQPYVSNDFVSFTTSYGNVLERIWFNSKGTTIFIAENVPLFVEVKEESICFSSKFSKHFKPVSGIEPVLKMKMCDTNDAKEAIQLVSELFIDRPQGIPDGRMFRSPIWSTWAKYKTNINEETILSYADEIIQHGFSNSQLEIDDMYSSTYGDFDFELKKFENATRMVSNLKSKGFRVTVWVTPFANLNSRIFETGTKNSYWLEGPDATPALVKWWQGIGGVLDVTNPKAVDWYIDRLNMMKNQYGIDSFKFDAGETNYVPSQCKPKQPWADTTSYATKYVDAVSKFGPMIEVRCGYRSQRHPVFVRMADKESRWGYENGLKTLIPTILTLGVIGYPYILPDMIGGNGYNYEDDVENPFVSTKIPERELYIRWLEVTAYFPAMQFSFVPWQYDTEVIKIAREFVNIHENVVTPIVLHAAQETVTKGTPIIRPLWWLDPYDMNGLETDSEFLVGDSLLVAPILDKGSRERDIYLPKGIWEDKLSGETVRGPKWLKKYKINLDQVATFWLVDR